MKKLRGIGTAGLTLVELIISMAILAVIGTAIGGAMYVSSRSYTRGASEINVQEEAQVASNLICDWIIDATSVNPDGSGSYLTGSYDYLEIIHPEGDMLVKVLVQMGTGADSDKLIYTATDASDPTNVLGTGVLASNVEGCNFYTTFGDDRNVKISIDFNVNERTYRAVTDSSSRSHDFISTGGTSTVLAPSIRFGLVSNVGQPHVTLEPGMNTANSYVQFYVYVDGADPDTLTGGNISFTGPASAHTNIESCTRISGTNCWKVLVSADPTADSDEPWIFSCANSVGSDSKTLFVKIRRIRDCSFQNYTSNPSNTSIHYWPVDSGMTSGTANSTYTNTINLNASNWQDESANIVGAAAGVPREMGFDANPWGYIDPTALQVKFTSWNGSAWVDRRNDVLSCDITPNPSGNPTIKVKLKNDITDAIAVVVIANHAGSVTGHSNQANDPTCGFGFVSNNKARAIDGREVNYYSDNYDVIWISPTDDHHIHNVGGGVRRGVPACMIAEFDNQFKSNLIRDIKAKTGLATESAIKDANLHYCTYITYDEIDPNTGLGKGHPKTFVLANFTDFTQIFSDYIAQRIRSSQTQIFDLDKAYEIVYNFEVFNGGTSIVHYEEAGEVCAATPYVYDPNATGADTINFKNGKYTQTNPYHTVATGNNNTQSFGVYIDGVGFNEGKIQFICQVWDGSNWVSANNIVSWDDKQWAESHYTVNNVYYDQIRLPDGRSYDLNKYEENDLKLNNSRTQLEFIKINRANMDSGKTYRVVFYTPWKEATGITYGTINGDQNAIGQVTGTRIENYTLNGDFYFTK